MEKIKLTKELKLNHLIPIPNSAVKLEELDDEYVLFNAKNTKVTYLNASAAMVWTLCDGKTSVDDIITELTTQYPEQQQQINDDVMNVMQELVNNELLVLTDKSGTSV